MKTGNLSEMNAMEFNAFREQLRDGVILGWCANSNRESISDNPSDELLDEQTFDDGSTQHSMRVLYRLATDADIKAKKVDVNIMDQLDPNRSKMGWLKAPKALWDYLFTQEECPEGYKAGDIGKLPNHVVEWYSISQEVERRRNESVESDDAYEA
jgi:hypothetical protein